MNTYLGFVLVGADKSSKSVTRFSVVDLQDIASPKSLKKELATSSSKPEPKGMSTRGKDAKKRKTVEPIEGLPLMERQLHEYVYEKFAEVQILLDQHLVEAEQKNLDFQQIFLAKDKKISSLETDINALQKELLLTQITAQKERIEIVDGAKLSAAIAMLKIKLQMAKEAEDLAFDQFG
ncbi:hypothetical protein HanPI659440_Chr07g0273591 [Helianthus annuus]|nr:hypothetical protein HanPI659440_Chr07g0273591 [Helianthus annuus]